ncbi:4-hydroxysphinganine ceramide fatty acyl 2-hydroxylase [Marchantia polymorpha subsp. ruderalis]|uniref:Fatty acid 2-hydroxylase n=2 Tax=Marchantia polymorpha TaxID=3197 RepID=A0AAF6B9T0_MARPO|nr:hypothetical protein MARPO_0070s0052 [Marchantia polymorpha]BBN08764.1 hypothetical protein Mp_4g14300 [Marchantia polymorpha subsp. ruderalis]|eukprot:PTQ35589.1 hypothetical protein MARPO_0070s0052 [Marchantia polymorpha]
MYRMTLPLQQVALAPSPMPGHFDGDANARANAKQLMFLKNLQGVLDTNVAESVDDENLEKLQVQAKELTMKEEHDHEDLTPALLTVNGKVYDVASFLDLHPGGADLITEHLNGKDVGRLMKGLDEPGAHIHSKAAMKMLEQFVVQKSVEKRAEETTPVIEKKFEIDLTKPLVAQVGYLGKDYDEWVHTPIICKESPRFFESDWIEFLTRTKWWVIPLVWMPVVLWSEMRAVKFGLPMEMVIPYMLVGCGLWTIAEYLIHRFLFHMKATTYWTAKAHYVLHGFHHKHPMDSMRLVFPPAFTFFFSYALWWLMKAIFPNGVSQSVSGGGLLAYIVYDLTHYFLHYGNAFSERLRSMKRYHLNHHFKVQSDSFGITSEFWDWVFGTLPAQYAKLHSQ